jgi:sn-glycerol 3-phosphate transport system substrate-binding protein
MALTAARVLADTAAVLTTTIRRLAVPAAVLLVTAACGGGGSGSSTSPTSRQRVEPRDCGLAALAKATKPVEVTFWHVQAEVDATNLQELANTFNASQKQVHVTLVQQPSYPDAMEKWQAGLTTGDLPDVAQMEDTTVQRLVDSKSTVPVEACIEADHFDMSDFSERSQAFYTVGGVLQAMAWNVSNVALFYNKIDFQKAGLDPNDPPATLEEVRKDSQQLVDRGVTPHGLSLRIAPYFSEFWFAKAGQTVVNHGNGRRARATKAEIDTPTGHQLWSWWKDMVDSGLAINIGTDQSTIDHFLAIGNHQAAMTIEANATLSRIVDALASGAWTGLDIGVAPLPGIDSPDGGVPIGDGSLWLSKRSSPAHRAAAWQWIKFLVSKDSQVLWHTRKGAVPTRLSVADDPQVQALWAQKPEYKVGFDQLQQGPLDDATSGPLIGPYQEVRDAVTNGLASMLAGKASVDQALERAQSDADKAIADYNRRVGG